MVLILNGEVLQDNDPRAIRHRANAAAAAQRGPGGARQHAAGGPPGGGGGGVGGGDGGAAAPGAVAGPVELLAEKLGIAGKTLNIPAIPALGTGEVAIPYVWIAIAVIAYAIVSIMGKGQENRVLLVAALGLVGYVLAAPRQPAAAPVVADAGRRPPPPRR